MEVLASMTLQEALDLYYKEKDEKKKVELIPVIAHVLKSDIVKSLKLINEDAVKIAGIYTNLKRKLILIRYRFTHPYLGKRDLFACIKFSTQTSKDIVPSQIEKYLKVVENYINNEIYNGKPHDYDMTLIMLGPGFTSGVAQMPRRIGPGKFWYVATPETILEVLKNILEYFKARLMGLVRKLARRKGELEKEGIVPTFDEGIKAIKQFLKIIHAFKRIIVSKVKQLFERDFDEIAVMLINEYEEGNEVDLDLFL